MKKILVTGGAGFIGSHVLEKLLQHGCEDVTVLDSFVSGCRSHIPAGVKITEMDVRSPRLIPFMTKERFDCVIHLAAQTLVPYSMAHPALDAEINIMGLLNLLEGCRQAGTGQIIFSSSAAVYGDNPHLPIREDEPLHPLSFYGLSKAASEEYIRIFCRQQHMDGTILRFANVYGERQGEHGAGGVISIFARRIAAHEPLVIYGDGSQTRDFIYAGDIAEVIVRALGCSGVHTLNVATNTPLSLNELVSILTDIAGRPLPVRHEPEREGDIRESVLSNEMLRTTLGFRSFTPFRTGLERTLADCGTRV